MTNHPKQHTRPSGRVCLVGPGLVIERPVEPPASGTAGGPDIGSVDHSATATATARKDPARTKKGECARRRNDIR